MTAMITLDERLTKIYQRTFSRDALTADDHKRLAFLHVVVANEYVDAKGTVPLADALKEAEQKQGAQSFYTKFLTAMHMVRSWYTDPRNAGYHEIDKAINEAGQNCREVAEQLERSLLVLKTYRLLELTNEFTTALGEYANADGIAQQQEVIRKVSSAFLRIRAFDDADTLNEVIDIGKTHVQQGMYPEKPSGVVKQRPEKTASSNNNGIHAKHR